MKLERWNTKVAKEADKMLSKNDCMYCVTKDNSYFANRFGSFVLVGESTEINANPRHECKSLPGIIESAMKKSIISKQQEIGTKGKDKVWKFQNDNGAVFAADKLVRKFPKNVDFYISGPHDPIIVSIWENDTFNLIGVVMPVRNTSNNPWKPLAVQ